MNLGKFNNVINEINNYYEDGGLIKLFQSVLDAIQLQVSTPNTDNLKNFRTSIDNFIEGIRELPTYAKTATFIDVLDETGGLNYFGEGLEQSVLDLIHRQFVSPIEMQAELLTLQKSFTNYVTHIKRLATSMNALGVEYDSFEDDEYEFSALLPKEIVGSRVEDIQNELLHIDRLFKCLNEIMGKGSTSPFVKTISSSWWQFFLTLDETQTAAITLALERIVNLYKTTLEIRKLKADAEKLEMSEEVITHIEKQVEEKIKLGMAEIASKIRSEYQVNNDNERCNELEIQLKMELVQMAKKLNQGAIYEVKAALPVPPEQPELEVDGSISLEKNREYEKLKKKYTADLAKSERINAVNEMIVEVSNGMLETDNLLLLDYDTIK